MNDPRKLSGLKLSDLSIVGWYNGGRAYLSTWLGETTTIEVVLEPGVQVPRQASLMVKGFCQTLDSHATLKKLEGDVGEKLAVIAFGQFED